MPNRIWTRNTISIWYLVLHRNYWTDLHQNFTRYSCISDAIKSCIYKPLVHSVSDGHTNEWRLSILTLRKCSKINCLPQQRPLGYHKTYVSFVIAHTCDYLCWKANKDRSSSCCSMDDDRQIAAQFHLLGCSPTKLRDQSSPKFYTI